MTSKKQILSTLERSIEMLKDAGADFAAATFYESSSISVGVRNGRVTELTVTPNSTNLGFAVRIGDKLASTEPDTKRPDLLDQAARAAVAAARVKTDNPDQRRPNRNLLSRIRNNRELDLYDPAKPTIAELVDSLKQAESAALRVSKNINSEGGNALWSKKRVLTLNSDGDLYESQSSRSYFGVSVLAQSEGGDRANASEYTSARYRSDLRSPDTVGKLVGDQAVAELNPRRVKSGQFPVVFDPDMAAGLLKHFLTAASGSNIMMRQSFLNKDHLGQAVLARGVTIRDNPHKLRGFESTMYSSGLPTRPSTIVEDGILRSLILNIESARRLQLPLTDITGSASNIVIAPGEMTRDRLLEGIEDGFYVTSLMGQGVNTISGDYSRGASGFWIKNGALAYPVSEAAIAGNLRDMFMNVQTANDLDDAEDTVASPTLRIDGMTIS